jgi:hypothetical protein
VPSSFVTLENTGLLKENIANQSGSLLALNENGIIANNFIKETYKYRTVICKAFEDMEAGDFVYINENNEILKADAGINGRYAKGFIINDTLSDNLTLVYLNGINTGLKNLQVGKTYYLNYNGKVDYANVGYNKIILQKVGVAISKDKLLVNLSYPQKLILQTPPANIIPLDIKIEMTEEFLQIEYNITELT